MAQNVIAETRSAILPFVPHLNTLRWVLITLVLGEIAVTTHARLGSQKRGGGDRGTDLPDRWLAHCSVAKPPRRPALGRSEAVGGCGRVGIRLNPVPRK